MEGLNLNWLDIVIILVLAFGSYIGYRRGLIVTIFNTVGLIAALIVAKLVTNPVAAYLTENTKLYDKILEKVTDKIGTINPMTMTVYKLVNVESKTAAEALAGTVMSVMVFLAVFLVALIALSLVKHTLKAIADKTPIGAIDKLVGMVIGFVMSAIFIFVFFAVTAPFSGVAVSGTVLIDAIGSSYLAKYFFLYDPIIPWLEGMKTI